MNETTVTDVIEHLDYRCAVFSVVDADDVAILLKAYKVQAQQLAAVTDERDAAQGLLLATSAALDVMRQTAELAARPAAAIIKRLAECEGEKYAVTQERDMLQAWLKNAPLDAIVVLSAAADGPYSDSSLARVAHVWASNQDMNRYAATLRRVVAGATQVAHVEEEGAEYP